MKTFHPTKGSFLLSLIAGSILVSSHLLSAQEPSPISLTPVTQPPAAIPDSTVPPATTAPPVSTISQDAVAAEPLQIPQDVPLVIPQIQPAADIEPAVVEPATLAQDPPAPLPQMEAALPPINADEMAEEDQDELLRGPVHEAYAEQLNTDPLPGLVIPQKPPEAVEEIAPELKPDGRQVEWISGYWAWDEDQDDFIWVSGIWREVPQGFRWLPGYWTEVDGGYQWVNGTWVSSKAEEITYLNDAPPETLEQGPVGNSPSEQHIWIPGTWTWNETRYAWRPGYWSTGYDNWIWVPARYQWTPRGYYYCDGYWDYPIQRRGVLFAPHHFHRRFRPRRIARFTPRVVVASNLLTAHFWVRPRFRHYYFGNYYNVGFANRGLTPWHQFPRQRRNFDPLFAHYGRGRRSNDFYNQLNVQFNVFVNQPNRRPPIRFRDQDRWARDNRIDVRSNEFLGNRFQNFVESASRNRDGFQFVRLENQQREQVQQESRRLRELMDQRRDVERSLAQLERLRNIDANRGRIDRSLEGRGSEGGRFVDRDAVANRNDREIVDLRDGLNRDPGRNRGPEDSNDQRSDQNNRPDRVSNDRAGEADKNNDGRKGRDRLTLDAPPTDGSRTDEPNRGIIQDQIGKAKKELNDRRDRAEKNVRDAVERGTRITDGSPAAGDGKRDEPKKDGSKIDEPKLDRPKLDLPTRDDVKDQVRIRESRGRDDQPAPGASTDNSANIDEKNSNAVDRQTERQNRRDRLKLPAAAGVPRLDSVPRSRQDANNPAAGSSVPERREQNPSTDAPASRNRGTDRSQNRPASGGNIIENPATKPTPRSEARSRDNSATPITPPVNRGNATGEDKAPRMRQDSKPNRETVKEPAREPAVRNIPPQRERQPVGGGANLGSQPGNDRASRREAPPRADSPPASTSRIRGSEPRNIPGNVGNPGGRENTGGRVGGDRGAAREPRNNPSMGSPRGGDAGGAGRVSNPGAGRGNPGAGPASGSARGAGGGRRESVGRPAGGAGGAGGGGGGRRGREK